MTSTRRYIGLRLLRKITQDENLKKSVALGDVNPANLIGMDKDGDGKLTVDEYVEGQKLIIPDLPENVHRAAFSELETQVGSIAGEIEAREDNPKTRNKTSHENCELFKQALRIDNPFTGKIWAGGGAYFCRGGDLADVVEKMLDSKESDIVFSGINNIRYVPEDKRLSLIEKGLGHSDTTVRSRAVGQIKYVPQGQREEWIERVIDGKDEFVRGDVVGQIQYVAEEKRAALIEKVLKRPIKKDIDPHKTYYQFIAQSGAVQQICYAAEGERARLIRMVLYSPYESVRSEAANQIEYAPAGERGGLIRGALYHFDKGVGWRAMKMISRAPENERAGLIKAALGGRKDMRSGLANWWSIDFVPEGERAGLIKIALYHFDREVRLNAVDWIYAAPKQERTDLIRIALNHYFDKDVSWEAVAWIDRAPEEDIVGLFNMALEHHSEDVRRTAEFYIRSRLGPKLWEELKNKYGS